MSETQVGWITEPSRLEGFDQLEVVRQTILVVDDNEANRSLAEYTLVDEGYRVVLASRGAQGIAAFEKERPDCVLLDVRMPEMDGFTVCERIRSLPRGAETPILFFTVLRDVDTFDHALRVGADDFLTKPVRPAELVSRVRSALKLRCVSAEFREDIDLVRHQRDAVLRLELQKERMMAFVVHDLKNPVNAMDINAQLLLRVQELPERARDSVTRIRASAQQLTRMIYNLLDLSKSDQGQFSPRPSQVDLRGLVDEVISALDVSAECNEVTLQSAIEADQIYADEDLLRRTLSNLAENAIRYAPPNTSVTISATRLVDGVEIRVADAGRGIPPEIRDRVFDPFVQVKSGEQSGARGSHGLGLAFCKLVVEGHGGRIWIEDGTPGALFCMRFPHAP